MSLLLEKGNCLSQILHKDYMNREIKGKSYSDRAKHFDTNIDHIRNKLNGVRAQLDRGMANEAKLKSGQATDELNSLNASVALI